VYVQVFKQDVRTSIWCNCT